ncbi:MAG: glycosyltransferase family 4 protein [Candidatus Nanohaloarchaea archaeon]|nr:glycosyltransferase family 4 protein [Candidatus Nanohaloarchaea archaeon]
MKVLMPTWEYPPNKVGGVASHCGDLSRELAERGHEVTVVTYGEDEGVEHDEGVEVHRVSTGDADDVVEWTQLLNHGMRNEIARLDGDFDLVHAHDWTSVPSAVSSRHMFDIPLVFTLHSTERGRSGIHSDMSRMINDLEWYGTYESDATITVGSDLKEEVGHHFQVPEDKLHHIPNGVDYGRFQDSDGVAGRYTEDWEHLVLFVGRLCHQKGVGDLVDAVPQVLHEREDVKFVVAGGGNVEGYRSQAEELGVGHKVDFPGYVPEDHLVDLYGSADLTVMPSRYEPFGIVALESMAAGTPVVGSHVGGIKDTVTHEWNGLHTYPGNPESIKWGVEMGLQDETWREWMGKNAKETVQEDYRWDRIADRTAEIYEKATGT